MVSFPPFTHFALSVSNLDRSIAWRERLFEAAPAVVIDESSYRAATWFDPVFAIHEHQEHHDGDSFDEMRLGLDHLAFGCQTREESWSTRLDDLGISRGEIVDAWYGSGLAFRDPEFFVLASS